MTFQQSWVQGLCTLSQKKKKKVYVPLILCSIVVAQPHLYHVLAIFIGRWALFEPCC